MLEIFTHGARSVPKAAITFDDGPNPPNTEMVLDILDRFEARATFFVIGRWVERFRDSFERIVSAGHCVGNHSHTHRLHIGDYDEAEAVITNVTGKPTVFARAHCFDFRALSQSVYAQLPSTVVVDADVNPRDYSCSTAQEIVDAVLSDPALSNGSIIDLHDGIESDDFALRLARPIPMIEALPAIIAGLRDRGLEPVRLDELDLVDPVPWTPEAPNRMTVNPTGSGVVLGG